MFFERSFLQASFQVVLGGKEATCHDLLGGELVWFLKNLYPVRRSIAVSDMDLNDGWPKICRRDKRVNVSKAAGLAAVRTTHRK